MMKFSPALIAASLAATLAFGTAASAHPRLVSATPAPRATVSQPTRVALRFSERLVGAMTAADVVMVGMPGTPHHAPVRMAGIASAPGPDGRTLTLSLKRPLSPGAYLVNWHAVSVDTHRVQGSYPFSVR